METARPRGTDSARIIQVIETKALVGRGTEEDPCDFLFQYWSMGGELLASCTGSQSANMPQIHRQQ